MATEALESKTEEDKRREVKEFLRRAGEGEKLEVQRLAAEWWIEDLYRIEAEMQQEANLCQDADILWPEEREGYRTGTLEKEEARDEDEEENGNDGTMTSGEDIGGTDEDAERDNDVFDGDKDVDRDAVRVSGGSEGDEWASGVSNGDEGKD